MKRRNALQLTATLLGSTIIGAELFLSGCADRATKNGLFSEKDIGLLNDIAETILPETEDSPGARAANLGSFMALMVTDCYGAGEQEIFLQGLHGLNTLANKAFGSDFERLSIEDKTAFLHGLDLEARKVSGASPHYFSLMKQLTLLGYFTSEPGATKALRYNPLPGKYVGCIPYEEGDKAWAL